MPGGKWEFKSFSYICISAPTISDDPDELDSFIMVLLIKSPIKCMSCGSVQFLLLITQLASGWSSFLCLILDDSTSSALWTNHSEHFYTVSHNEMIWNFKTALENQKDLDLFQCWRPWTSETEELNFKTAFCVKPLGALYLLCNINFLPS